MLAFQEGVHYRTIQQRFGIKYFGQIYRWVKWFQTKQWHRLQQKRCHTYSDPKGLKLQQKEKTYLFIKQEIQKILKLKSPINKKVYLTIIKKYQQKIPLNQLMKWFGLAKTTYYRWLKEESHPTPLSPLATQIQKICLQNKYYNGQGKSHFVLGYRKVHAFLMNQGIKVNAKTVYFKMKELKYLCQTKKNRYFKTLRQQAYRPLSTANLLKNNFTATQPAQKLCADFTYFTYGHHQRLYLSIIMDLYNREIVAYQLAEKQTNHTLVLKTLQQLPCFTQPGIFHSDQGSQYTSLGFQKVLKSKNLIPSFSEKGSPSQNACVEAFFSNLKCETFYLEKKKFLAKKRLENIIHNFIQHYNQSRQLSFLNYVSPFQYKQTIQQALTR